MLWSRAENTSVFGRAQTGWELGGPHKKSTKKTPKFQQFLYPSPKKIDVKSTCCLGKLYFKNRDLKGIGRFGGCSDFPLFLGCLGADLDFSWLKGSPGAGRAGQAQVSHSCRDGDAAAR